MRQTNPSSTQPIIMEGFAHGLDSITQANQLDIGVKSHQWTEIRKFTCGGDRSVNTSKSPDECEQIVINVESVSVD